MGGKEREHFAWFGMSAGIGFRVQHLVVDDDVEDSSDPVMSVSSSMTC